MPAGAPTEGVPATSSRFNTPYGIAKDGSGNLYICDETNNVVRKVDASGNVTLFAGNGTAGYTGDGGAATAAACELNAPVGVAVDGAGNVYIADYRNNAVRMVNTSGIISTIAGNGTAGPPYGASPSPASAAHITPRGITVHTAGGMTTVYVSDSYVNGPGTVTNYKVRGVAMFAGSYYIGDVAGNGMAGAAPFGDGGAATSANLDAPRGLSVDASGNLYIADMSHNLIRMVNGTTGNISTVVGNDLAGTAGYGGDGGAATAAAAQISAPTGVAVDGSGNLYVADVGSNRIRYVNTTGTISTIAGDNTPAGSPYGDGGPALSAYLNAPVSLALDGATGNYYISDQGHNLVRYVNASLAPPTFTGGSPQTLTVCENSGATSINSLLQAAESTTGLTLTWSTATAPAHGTLVSTYSTTSTGASITPTGLTYTPNTGFSGTDNFTVHVSNGTSTATTTINVTVNPLPVVAAIAGPTSTVCVGSNITFTDATTGGVWAAANSNASVSGGTVTGAVAGTDNIYYIVTNACGPDTVTAPVTINPTGAPSVSISSTLGTSACGVSGTFTASPIGGGAAPAYQWSLNGSPTGVTSATYVDAPVAGDVISVHLTSSSPCAIPSTANASITMVAAGTIVPAISISSGIGDTVCVGVPVAFTSAITNGGSSPSYNWTINGVPSGTGNTFVYIASATSAGDIIQCTLTSSIPCASPSAVTSGSVIIQLRSASSASLSISAVPGDVVCAGTHVTFTAAETGGGGAPLLRWTRAGVNVATGPTYTTIPADGDVVYCTMHSSIACSATDSVLSNLIGMTVEPVVIPVVTVTSSKTVTGVGEPVTFIATVTSATLTPGYQWYVNGVAVPGATSSHFLYTSTTTGSAVVNCAVSSGDACNTEGVSGSVSITISDVGVRQPGVSYNEMKLVPNPNKGAFTMNLQSDRNEQVNVVITNILGEKVIEFTTTTNTTMEIKLDQAPGVYILSAITNRGSYVTKVMVN